MLFVEFSLRFYLKIFWKKPTFVQTMATNNDEDYEKTIDNLQTWFEENKNLPKQIGKWESVLRTKTK